MNTTRRDFFKGLLAAAVVTQIPGLNFAEVAKAAKVAVEQRGDWFRISSVHQFDGEHYTFSVWVKGDLDNVKLTPTKDGKIVVESIDGEHITISLWRGFLALRKRSSLDFQPIARDGRPATVEHSAHNLIRWSNEPTRWLLKNVTAISGEPG